MSRPTLGSLVKAPHFHAPRARDARGPASPVAQGAFALALVTLTTAAFAAACGPGNATTDAAHPTTTASKPAPSDAGAASPTETTARAFVEGLSRHDWQCSLAALDDGLKTPGKGATAETLEAFWKPLEAEGKFEGIDGVAIGKRGEVEVALVVCRFGQKTRVIRLTVTPKQRVAGLFQGSTVELVEPDARAFVAALAAHDSASAYALFNEALRGKVGEKDLVALWQGIEGEIGEFKSVERVNVVAKPNVRAFVHGRFAKGGRVVMLGFDDNGQVAGIKVLPETADPAWTPPSYAKQEAFTEKPASVGTPSLPGFLTVPTKPGNAPVVVLVHRDGPQDEDESVGAIRPFKDLAWGLATRGIAVLRYRKRSLADLPKTATEQDEVREPALAAIEALRKTPGIDPARIVVLGHGQGGAHAPAIARDGKAQGVVILAGPTRSLQDNLVEEFTYLSSLDPSNAALRSQIDAWKKVKQKADDPALQPSATIELPTGGAISGAYFLFARTTRPTATAAALTIPILVGQGDRDFHVPPAQLDEWKKALLKSPRASFKSYAGASHLFTPSTGAKGTPADYEGTGHVDEQVVSDVAAFVLGIK